MLSAEPSISVVICTHNRAEWLRRVLGTLCAQTLSASDFEIVVVDNGSTDATRWVVEEIGRTKPNVRYVAEGRIGSSYARNSGWAAARGRYVAFMDDDCKAPEQWLTVALRIIDDIAPAAFGGPILPFYDDPKPGWYRDAYVTHRPGDEADFLEPQQFGRIFGGNMFVRRNLFEATGGFDSQLGPRGQRAGFGEDTALMKAIAIGLEERIYYHPDLFVFHLVRSEKLLLKFWVRAQFLGGKSQFRLSPGSDGKVADRRRILLKAARELGRLAFAAAGAILWRDRVVHPYPQNYAFEKALPHVRKLGWLYEAFWHSSRRRTGA
jgi:glucosyl-dolichyl phosphate glucuronosyltransferase